MQGAIVFFVILGIAVFVFAAIYISHVMEKKRTERMISVAEEMGLTFLPAGDRDLHNRLYGLKVFNQGSGRKLWNLITGEADAIRLSIFDYQYVTGSGKQQQTHQFSITCLESPVLRIPSFSLRPEGFWDKVGGMLGFQDIDFDNHPEFSAAFVCQSPKEAEVREFFDQSLLDFFVTVPNITLEAQPGIIIVYRSGRRKPEELKGELDLAYKIYGKIEERLGSIPNPVPPRPEPPSDLA